MPVRQRLDLVFAIYLYGTIVVTLGVMVIQGVQISKFSNRSFAASSLEDNYEQIQQIGSVVCFRSNCYRRGCSISR